MKAYGQKCHFGLIFFYSIFSLFSHHFILFSSLSITLYLFPLSPPYSRSLTTSPRHQPPQPLPPTFRSLYRVVGVIFGMGFDVWVLGHWLISWVGILGWWWCHGCGGGWLSFGSKMFVAVVGSGVCGCSGFRCVGFESMIDWLGWDFGPVVVSWLWRWLVEFWASDICGYSGSAVFVGDPVIVIVVCGGWFAVAIAIGGLWRLIVIVV